jgi:copper chaperone
LNPLQTVFTVGMTCQGCAGAVTRILKKLDGVDGVATDVPKQTVTVTHADAATPEAMLAALKKWGDASGKKVELKAA